MRGIRRWDTVLQTKCKPTLVLTKAFSPDFVFATLSPPMIMKRDMNLRSSSGMMRRGDGKN